MPISPVNAVPIKIVPDLKLPEGYLDFPVQFNATVNAFNPQQNIGVFQLGVPPVSLYNILGAAAPVYSVYAQFQPQYNRGQTQLSQVRCVEYSMTVDATFDVYLYVTGTNRVICLQQNPGAVASGETKEHVTINGCIEINADPNAIIYLIIIPPQTTNGSLGQGFLNFTNYRKNQFMSTQGVETTVV